MAAKYKTRNEVQIQVSSGGYLQYQIPGIYAQQYYGKKQKYIAFGAKNGGKAYAEAEDKLALLKRDLEDGVFNPNDVSKYKSSSKQSKNFYTKTKNVTLLSLFDDYTDFRFDKNDDGTGRFNYQDHYRPVVEKCDIQDVEGKASQRKIAEFISKKTNYHAVTGTLSVIGRAIKRGISVGDLHENTPNIFPAYLKEYKKNTKPPKLKYPKVLSDQGFIKDDSKIAWTLDEMKIIINAFRKRNRSSIYYKKCDVLTLLVEFLFYTGVRHGEAFGLKWNAINKDLSQAFIHRHLESKNNVLKCTKTGKNRTINLSNNAQEVLVKIQEFYEKEGIEKKPNSFVFLRANGQHYRTSFFAPYWRGSRVLPGREKKYRPSKGVVTQLVMQGELNNYIEPYSTRRTFTSLMAQRHDPRTVADYIGDNVETILKHYYSGKENFKPESLF